MVKAYFRDYYLETDDEGNNKKVQGEPEEIKDTDAISVISKQPRHLQHAYYVLLIEKNPKKAAIMIMSALSKKKLD